MIVTALAAVIVEEYNVRSQPVVYAASVEEVVEPKEIQIRVVRNWDEEKIIDRINEVFWDAPAMVQVARCESGYKPDAFNPTNNSNDRGIFQISEKYHKKHYEKLGLDMFDPEDNIQFARILYDAHGLQPWVWSKHCWS